MKYFEIVSGTDLYNQTRLLFDYKLEWMRDEVRADFESLGIVVEKNLEMNPTVLCLVKIPAGAEAQFKKRTSEGRYKAKQASELNKKYLEIVKKHNLKSYTMWDLVPLLDSFEIPMLCPVTTKVNFRLFFAVENTDKWQAILEKFEKDARLKEVKESEYLSAKLEATKEHEAEET